MITKAIIEEVISPYKVRIRVPLLDRAEGSALSTSEDSLVTATICSLPNCYMNSKVGDIVFVGFEDNTYYKGVILGHLSREAWNSTYSDMNIGNLDVHSRATLPYSTTIGNVTSEQIHSLLYVKDNIQSQIDSLTNTVETLSKQLKELITNETEEEKAE